jgi:hypothetical protein
MTSRGSWSEPTSTDEAHARAAGRRRYNALRQERAQLRRGRVAELALEYGGLHYGVQASIARQHRPPARRFRGDHLPRPAGHPHPHPRPAPLSVLWLWWPPQ